MNIRSVYATEDQTPKNPFWKPVIPQKMAPIIQLSHLANPLASSTQLETSATQLHGVPKHLEDSVRFRSAQLIQAAGILLRLPQEIIAQSIVLLYRFWIGPDGCSMLEQNPKDAAAAALYVTAKPSGCSISPRQVLVVFEYLSTIRSDFTQLETAEWHFTASQSEVARDMLYHIEARILTTLGFQTHISLPYTLCINYLQTLDVFNSDEGSSVAKRAFEHLNTALLSPQLLYITHQPTALATAAIYLAAREVNVKLPDTNWWEVFDVDREELGFLVVALRSVEGFALEEKKKWEVRQAPLTVTDLRTLLSQSHVAENGDY